MKRFTLITGFLITCSIFSQNVYRLDSTLVQNWDIPNNEWVDNLKNHYYYDNGGILDTRVYQLMYNINSLDSISRQIQTYSNDNLTESTFESFDGMNWAYNTKDEYEYNADNKVTLQEGYFYSGSWVNNSSQENTYDAGNGNITEELFKSLDFISNTLVNDERNIYTYNTDALLEQEISQTWLSTLWFNQIRNDHFYLTNGLTDYIDRFDWLGTAWSGIMERTLIFYDSNDLLVELRSQIDSGGSLVNDGRVINSYDSNPNLTQVTGQTWNGSSWDNATNLIQNYNTENNIEEQISQIWDVPNNQWLNQVRFLSYWSLAESLSVTFVDALDINVYPNPAKDILQVQLPKAAPYNLEVLLFDISGRQLSEYILEKGSQQFTMSFRQQVSGTYFLKISTSGSSETFRIIKE